MVTAVNTQTRPVTNGAYYAASVLYQAGFRGWPLTVMTTIAGVESNWTPTDLNNNPNTGDYSVGLTQVNYYGNLLQSRTQAYGSPQTLQSSPAAQASATYNLAGGNTLSGLSNWGGGSWNGQNGSTPSFSEAGYAASFLAHLSQAAAAVGQVGTFGPAPAATTAQASAWPGTNGGSVVTAGGYAGAADLTSATTAPTGGCASQPPAWSFGGVLGIGSFSFSACERKAFVASLALVGSTVLLTLGVILVSGGAILGHSPVGRALGTEKQPSASTLGGSPDRRGSASSHGTPRSVGQEPDIPTTAYGDAF